MSRTLLTDEVRAYIGREETYTAPEPLSAAAFRYFSIAIGEARERWREGIASPTFICESNQYLSTRAEILAGGHSWNLPVTGCRVLRGGHEYEFFRPVRAGDHVAVTWRIGSMTERESKNGKSMLIVNSEARYTTTAYEPLALNHETLIYQEL